MRAPERTELSHRVTALRARGDFAAHAPTAAAGGLGPITRGRAEHCESIDATRARANLRGRFHVAHSSWRNSLRSETASSRFAAPGPAPKDLNSSGNPSPASILAAWRPRRCRCHYSSSSRMPLGLQVIACSIAHADAYALWWIDSCRRR